MSFELLLIKIYLNQTVFKEINMYLYGQNNQFMAYFSINDFLSLPQGHNLNKKEGPKVIVINFAYFRTALA